ncbi:hypothetical protein A1356_22850 [Methylomonas koyamae]|uniref:Uncharacterized protein n=1 Tax=Methylomonas koyamae TaxID=702114 RepID=A0AA91DFT9_9GAMM|nr:hypothetical protein A1356_22850 [Methylomonas koyamae]
MGYLLDRIAKGFTLPIHKKLLGPKTLLRYPVIQSPELQNTIAQLRQPTLSGLFVTRYSIDRRPPFSIFKHKLV